MTIARTSWSRRRTHGMSGSPEYNSWLSMRHRCESPSHRAYSHYGGRGITVCERWRQSFATFFADMGPRPHGHTLDRIDNYGPYSPANCRWSTNEQQASHRSTSRWVTYNGVTMTTSQWARSIGMRPRTFQARLRRGFSFEAAMTIPLTVRQR